MTIKGRIDQNEFSPERGLLRPGEMDFRREICLNGSWDFQPLELPANFVPGGAIPALPLPQPDQWEKVKLKVPSPWNINGLVDKDGIPGGDFVCYPSYPRRWKDVKMGWMRRRLRVPEAWSDHTIQLHFQAVCGHCQVYLDGVKVGEHFDNSLPQSYSLDGFVVPGMDHELWVGVWAAELLNFRNGDTQYTYPTGSFFNLNTAGIWQDVTLLGYPRLHIQDVYVQPDLSADQLRVQVTIENRSGQTASLVVHAVVKALQPFAFPDDGVRVVPHHDLEETPIMEFPPAQIAAAADKKTVLTLETTVAGKLRHWDVENPRLYAILVSLEQGGKTTDRKVERFGWRQFKIMDGGFYLNDRKIQVKADSWHFMGIPQLSRRYAFAWYRAIKDAGGNGVRLHAMPYPTFYLEVADEMGIIVLDESAIWASHCQNNYDEPITWERFSDHLARLVRRDRNYPSVMGWSVENEVRMALEQPFQSEETIAAVGEKICSLMEIVRRLDPTRDWISADGSQDWDGRFPTRILHYVNKESYAEIARRAGKPVGVGECTIAYYGTPKHAAAFIGDLAFRSAEDRMKGVAIESYGELKAQSEAGFSYQSVFNLAWYALKPLPLGHPHPEHAPKEENGIFFHGYQEGKPGVQPERLGPYCTTFNPGYDPDLPLYEPWPMFEAIKTAFSPSGPLPSAYDRPSFSPPPSPLSIINQTAPIVFLGEADGLHHQGLRAAGVLLNEDPESRLIYADLGTISPEQEAILKERGIDFRAKGGTLFLSGLTPASQGLLEEITGEKIEIFEREASSLVFGGEVAGTDPLVDHFHLQDLYFSEEVDPVIQRFGIRGGLGADAAVLLQACGCDWRLWNYQAETSKTGALYRSEKEMPAAHALVLLTRGQSRILLNTIEISEDRSVSERRRRHLWHQLMKALGARMEAAFGKQEAFSSYTPAGIILQNPEAKAVVRRFIPLVSMLTDEMIREIHSFNIRELARMYPILLRLSEMKLNKIDQALSGIRFEPATSLPDGAGGTDRIDRVLAGDQIIRVLAAGPFAGRDSVTLLVEELLDGECSLAPVQTHPDEAPLIRWGVETAGPNGFLFDRSAAGTPATPAGCYLSFYLHSPLRLDDLLTQPNVPRLSLNLETVCCLRIWLNSSLIFTKALPATEALRSQVLLPLRQGSNHILIKVVGTEADFTVRAFLSSTYDAFIGKLAGALELQPDGSLDAGLM